MAGDEGASPEWALKSVLETAKQQAGPGHSVTVQIFLDDKVKRQSVNTIARETVEQAASRVGVQSTPAHIGKVHPLAKSFSVTADPAVLEEIAKSPLVKSLLPSTIEDVYPKPVKSVPVR